jgi:thiosulfate dehydrogenase [quinone] large subunit
MSRTEKPTRIEPTGRSGFAAGLRANSWPVLPLRAFLAALFLFAGYAKFSYPGFFDPGSPTGLKASVDSVRHGTPIGAALGPLSEHPSLFGHITAIAEIAIGLGLLVGLLTRIAALGGMVLTALIVLSIDWGGVKQYTGSSGWFTSVDLAVAAALSVFLLGGAGPLSLDRWFVRSRARRRARDDAEPGFGDHDLEDTRRRLQGAPASATQQLPVADPSGGHPQSGDPQSGDPQAGDPQSARSRQVVEEEPDPYSLWNSGRESEPDGPPRR